MSDLIIPDEKQIQRVQLGEGFLTDYGQEFMDRFRWEKGLLEGKHRHGLPPIAGGASFSDAYEAKVLGHISGKAELVLVTPIYLALTTVVPTDSSTGITITEATYTGYARKSITAANLEAAAEGSPSKILNGAELVFAACSGSTSTIIGFALTDKSETSKGNNIMWGTATSTVISTTQTPATVAAKALEMTLD